MINIRFLNTKDETSWVEIDVYVPNTKWGRKHCWMEMSNHRMDFVDEVWVIMGDFNTPLKENKNMRGSQPNLDGRMDLMEFIDNHMLHEWTYKVQVLPRHIDECVSILYKLDLIEHLLSMTGFKVIISP